MVAVEEAAVEEVEVVVVEEEAVEDQEAHQRYHCFHQMP
jgi:hypothetical protein